MQIHVTAEDLASGIRGDCVACLVARALKRALGIEVLADLVFLWRPRWPPGLGKQVCVPTPWPARAFIEQFDRGERPAPFTFELPDGDVRRLLA